MIARPSKPNRSSRSTAYIWGSLPAERQQSYPCDKYIPQADDAYFRAVEVNAPASILFRWLCQLKVAPYSYDWIDNRGRRSPRQLTPGLEHLAVGQKVMSIFTLVEFEPNRHLTLVMTRPRSVSIFGKIAGTYVIASQTDDRCRLIGKLIVQYPSGSGGNLMRWFLPWGDFFMARKQFLTLKSLAERDARRIFDRSNKG